MNQRALYFDVELSAALWSYRIPQRQLIKGQHTHNPDQYERFLESLRRLASLYETIVRHSDPHKLAKEKSNVLAKIFAVLLNLCKGFLSLFLINIFC